MNISEAKQIRIVDYLRLLGHEPKNARGGHHRTRGEGSVEALQGRAEMHAPGSHRSLLSRLGCQRYKQVPAFRPEGECGGACVESEKEG